MALANDKMLSTLDRGLVKEPGHDATLAIEGFGQVWFSQIGWLDPERKRLPLMLTIKHESLESCRWHQFDDKLWCMPRRYLNHIEGVGPSAAATFNQLPVSQVGSG
jgi:hypothetical protein